MKISKKSANAGNSDAVLTELSAMKTAGAALDLGHILDNDHGHEVYSAYVSNLNEAGADYKKALDVLGLCAHYHEVHDFEDESPEHAAQLKAEANKIVESVAMLPSDIPEDATKAVKDAHAAEGDEEAPINTLTSAIVDYLSKETFENFKQSGSYAALQKEIGGEEDASPAAQVPAGATKLLVYTPLNVVELQEQIKAQGTKSRTQLMNVGQHKDGSPAFEAWVTVKNDSETVIGRDSGLCHCYLTDSKVSRNHAKVVVESDGTVLFKDLGSSHGSKVNGKYVGGRAQPLAVGDNIKVGKTHVTFTIIPEGETEPTR